MFHTVMVSLIRGLVSKGQEMFVEQTVEQPGGATTAMVLRSFLKFFDTRIIGGSALSKTRSQGWWHCVRLH